MKKHYKNAILLSAFSFASLCVTAQEGKQENSFKQPESLIQIDVQQKSSQNIFQKYIGLSEGNSYTKVEQKTDKLGITHEKFQQMYKGVKVEFGTTRLNSKNGRASSLSGGEYFDVNGISTTPKLSATQALQRAITNIGATQYMWDNSEASKAIDYKKPEGELVILPNIDSKGKDGVVTKFNLAYKFDIYATAPKVSRGYVYVDASTGGVLFYNSIIKHVGEHSNSAKNLKTISVDKNTGIKVFEAAPLATGNAATRYSGNKTITTRTISGSFALRDNTRGSGVNTYNSGGNNSYPSTNFTDGDNNWTAAEFDNAAKDNAALDAHWGAEVTYDYWSTVHSRNSFNGSGAAINSWVHYDNQPGGAGYDNAFWNGSVMTYGDGSSNGTEGNGFFDALTSLDVAAHEIGHAVTTFTADLAYRRESGGLNEGFSDIWGAAVEHFAKGNGNDAAPSADTWLIGDEIDRRNGSAALRSMSDPKSLGQPDTYRGTNWRPATVAEGCITPIGNPNDPNYNDQCGVHTNSGVLNYWFYLAVAGSAGTDGVNDNGDAFTVAGIGMDKAAKIAYRTLNVYLSANSTFLDARNGSIQAAKDLYTAGGAEEIAVTNAWHAVGVGQPFGGGGSTSYCGSNGNSVADEYIGRVQLGTINNATGAGTGGYNDFTSISTNLEKGSSNTISITPTWTGTQYNEGYSVWIDYNQDGDFADAGEQVFTQAATQTTPVSGSFTVPSGATDGATRMRVSMKYNGIPTACESFQYGEVEDYEVVIGAGAADTQAPSIPTGLAASSVAETTLTLSWNAATDNVGVTGYDVYQGSANLGNVTGTSANITGLTANTAYQFSVRAKDAAGNTSASSSVVNVTTAGGGASACTSGITSFPYNEGFENTLGAWSQSTTDDIDWTIDASGTPSRNTGPSSATQGSYYLFVEASGSGTGYPDKQAVLESPCFDLSGLSSASFSFSYHMYGATDMGSLAVDASTDEGATWTSLWSQTGNKGNSWLSANIDLSAYAGGGVKLRFNRITGSTWQADIAIDNVAITSGAAAAFAGTTPTETINEVFSLWPNPLVQGQRLSVSIKKSTTPQKYTIINAMGQKVDEGAFNGAIDTDGLRAGLYFLNLDGNKKPFVVQ
ncbi:M4 family metallopeptidase [Aquimarina sp. 2304DJ70-9]|uniref:M4 family metallopeptidase n=1 Tax=Aquimarina penaris TaxID=3231044 RepID=UPI00346269C2